MSYICILKPLLSADMFPTRVMMHSKHKRVPFSFRRERADAVGHGGELQPGEAALGVRGANAHRALLLRPPADSQHAVCHWRGLPGTQ